MEENNKTPQPKILEMAKKRRHIYLLEKLQKGPTLSKSEVAELGKYESDPNSPGIVDSQEKVAKVFGVSVRTVARWLKDGMPVLATGGYNLKDINDWRHFHNDKISKKTSKEKQELDFWDARYRKAKALNEEDKLRISRGELIQVKDVEKGLIQVSLAIKRAFLGLPRSVAPQLKGLEAREIEAILVKRVKEIIIQFAEGKIFKQIKRRTHGKNSSTTQNLD